MHYKDFIINKSTEMLPSKARNEIVMYSYQGLARAVVGVAGVWYWQRVGKECCHTGSASPWVLKDFSRSSVGFWIARNTWRSNHPILCGVSL